MVYHVAVGYCNFLFLFSHWDWGFNSKLCNSLHLLCFIASLMVFVWKIMLIFSLSLGLVLDIHVPWVVSG